MDTNLKQEILDSISKQGKIEEPQINVNTQSILDPSSGTVRLQTTVVRKAKLIISQPENLQSLSNLQIRCCLCSRVISYPCWYYQVRYRVNHFHYFICFDSDNPGKPNAKCYRRNV